MKARCKSFGAAYKIQSASVSKHSFSGTITPEKSSFVGTEAAFNPLPLAEREFPNADGLNKAYER